MQKTPLTTPSNLPEPMPFFEQLQQEMERLFDRFRGYPTVTAPGMVTGLSPAIDVAESDDAIEITAEIPGVDAKDLDVSLSGDILVLKGEKADERTEEEKNYHLHERSYGSFRRQIPLGFVPADDAINAQFTDGLLRLTVTKPAEVKDSHRKIAIGTK